MVLYKNKLGKYSISSTSQKSIQEEQKDKLWRLIKTSQKKSIKRIPHDESNDYIAVLHKGDIIKLGRVSFLIKDLKAENVPSSGGSSKILYKDNHDEPRATKSIPGYHCY